MEGFPEWKWLPKVECATVSCPEKSQTESVLSIEKHAAGLKAIFHFLFLDTKKSDSPQVVLYSGPDIAS